jgi:hypothetical protein
MRTGPILTILCTLAAAGCAQMQPGESPTLAAHMQESGEQYLACISREAEKDMTNPTGAEDIATAAHGRCWSVWEAYRAATNANFSYGAQTAGERQFAGDRAEAHVRQFEREARRMIVDTVVQRSLGGAKSAP